MSGDDDPDLGELAPYVAGTATAPLPTYFVGAHGVGAAAGVAALAAPAAAGCGIHYLGRAGVASVAGLSVAFLDGTFSPAALGDRPAFAGACRHFTMVRGCKGGWARQWGGRGAASW